MFSKLLLATALTLSLGGAAFAQTGQAPTGSATPTPNQPAGETGMPQGWSGDIGNAFFSDMNAGTLRGEAEIATNWSSLSAEQQAQVKLDCNNMQADASGASKTDTTTTSATSSGTTTGTAMGGATGGASASQSDHAATMSQLCDWVKTQ